MKQGFRQSMAWLHTWTGLLVSWLLLLIFMGGTASYYREEISRWMRPELARTLVSPEQAATSALAYLQREAPNADYWNVTLPDARNPALDMYWMNPAAEGAGNDRAARRARGTAHVQKVLHRAALGAPQLANRRIASVQRAPLGIMSSYSTVY